MILQYSPEKHVQYLAFLRSISILWWICQFQLARFMYTKIILIDIFTYLQCHSLWGSACHYVILHYSHCKSESPSLLMRFNPLQSALGFSDRCLTNFPLLAACLHFTHLTPVSLCLVLNIGAVAWHHTFSKPLRVPCTGLTSPKHFIHSQSIARGGEFFVGCSDTGGQTRTVSPGRCRWDAVRVC